MVVIDTIFQNQQLAKHQIQLLIQNWFYFSNQMLFFSFFTQWLHFNKIHLQKYAKWKDIMILSQFMILYVPILKYNLYKYHLKICLESKTKKLNQ